MNQSTFTGSGYLDAAAVSSVRGGARVPEDWGDAAVTEDGSETGGKEEPAAVERVESQSTEDDPQVRGGSCVTDQRGAGGTRELGEATRPRVPRRADGGRSQGRADRSMG